MPQRVISIDLTEHPNADTNITVNAKLSFKPQADLVLGFSFYLNSSFHSLNLPSLGTARAAKGTG